MADAAMTAAQQRMQVLADTFTAAVDNDMRLNGQIPAHQLLLAIAAFVGGTCEALEVRTGQHRDTVLRVFMGTLLHVMETPPPPPPTTDEGKPN